MKHFLCLLIVACSLKANAAKIRKEEYLFIDNLVTKAGKMEGYSLQYITDSITAQCKDELQMTRAFYRWCFLNIRFDLRRLRHPGREPDNASAALMERKAAAKGYAELFKAMCDVQHIECRVVRGLLRMHREDIGTLNRDAVHYWNIVRIDHTDYLIDPSLGGGIWDHRQRFIDRTWTDAWWLTNRRLFSFTHLPDKPEDQLLELPVKPVDFKNAPIPTAKAIVIGLMPQSRKGTLKGYADSSLQIQFQFAGPVSIGEMTANIGPATHLPVMADIDELGYVIDVPLPEKGEHFLELYCVNTLVFIYKLNVAPGRKKKPRS